MPGAGVWEAEVVASSARGRGEGFWKLLPGATWPYWS